MGARSLPKAAASVLSPLRRRTELSKVAKYSKASALSKPGYKHRAKQRARIWFNLGCYSNKCKDKEELPCIPFLGIN